ncbi:hypothetical protein NDK47_11120 [Brevibacillus ruminantium]|uniref:Uncharacterized protein n=1 Tax=Brevibacillus ruminantium TaxID=2950604 RepID=A0ABY4WKW3_9BACL|nr:hypothetical protein [Brevibacillus ruminantium]USG67785.1 hypothetical protein NDK47_11120 [Brevibacillus ruminantium]
MALAVSVGKAVPQESYFAGSIIARQAFTVSVSGAAAYSSVTIYANSTSVDKGFNLGTITTNAIGSGSRSVTISQVFNNGSNRKITVVDSSNNSASITVGVWFKGRATVFQGNSSSYYVDKGCTPLTTNYVALPSYSLCGKNVAVVNTANGNIITAPVNDVGPYFDANYCKKDEYWNTGTVPLAEQYDGKQRCEACGVPCNTTGDKRKISRAIIDLSPQMMSSLGGSTEVTAAWRFT